jgi:DNA-binding transcriptional regulator YiaG
MRCEECNIEMVNEQSTEKEPFRFDRCGLDHVYLVGIDKFVCPRCKAVYPIVPRIEELHKVIASALVNRTGDLAGPEVRYLRSWMGMKSQDFADVLGCVPEHLSKVENGHTRLGASGDKLVRTLVRIKLEETEFEEVVSRLRKLKRLKASKSRVIQRRLFDLESGRIWKERKVA